MIACEIKDFAKASEGEAEVEIFLDANGIEFLRYQLDLIEGGESHVHLMSPAWAGDELSDKPMNNDSNFAVVHHVKLVMTKST